MLRPNDGLTLNMEVLRSLETSVHIYQSTQHNTPEELDLQQYRCENVLSCILSTLTSLDLPMPPHSMTYEGRFAINASYFKGWGRNN
jgi:hypothetical protein